MDRLTFIAEIVKATAWPLAVLAVFLVLRKQLVAVLPGLESLKWKDFEARFSRRVHEVSEEAREALPGPQVERLPPAAEQPELLRLAELSPRAAILEAWIALEDAAATALRRKEAPRNAAAHASDPKITLDDAREFVRVASSFERLIRAGTPPG